jgi:MFS family permease
LFSLSQAGMVNNLNDALMWGLVPIILVGAGLSLQQTGAIAAVYPGVWGIGQLATGTLSDRWGRKCLIIAGMWIQAIGITLFALGRAFWPWMAGAVLLGVGTACVYPTLLAAVSDGAHPNWRASAVGVYRLWRDGGYAVGALLTGVLTDVLGAGAAIWTVAALTFLSGAVALAWIRPHPTVVEGSVSAGAC